MHACIVNNTLIMLSTLASLYSTIVLMNTEETIMTDIPPIPRSVMSLPSLPAEYEEPDMTVESEYEEIWSSEDGDNEHIFDLGPCSAYK